MGNDAVDGMLEYPLYKTDELADEAWAAMRRQETDEALRLWQALRDLSPERPEGHIWPIQMLWQAGRFGEAEAMAAQALALLPDHAELLVQHAWVATAQSRWDEAARRWAAVRARMPERFEGYVWGARALWQAGWIDDAEAISAEGLRRVPEHPDMMAEHAWVATVREDWPEAVRRWTPVHEAHPERSDAPARLAQALRLTGRPDDSEAAAATGLAAHPNDTELLIEHVWSAVAREDWPAAAARLDAARRSAEDAERVAQSLNAIEPKIRAGAAAAAQPAPTSEPTPADPSAAADEDEMSPSALMLSFESIGERCDFGAVQRYLGIEPLGLLRFAWSKLPSLVAALEDRFDAVGTLDDTSFERFGEETIVWMRKYDLIFHTFVEGVDKLPPEKQEIFQQQQRRRLLFLKDKLIRDLEEPQKILVYATADYASDDEMVRLFTALRAYGPNSLLYVRPESADRPAGTVEARGDGLYAGYFPGLTDFMGGGKPPLDVWRELCLQTYRMVNGASDKNYFLKSLL